MSGLNINLSDLLSGPVVPDVQVSCDFGLDTARALFFADSGIYFNYVANPFLKTIDLARFHVDGTTTQMQDAALAYVAEQNHITEMNNSEEWLAAFRQKLDLKLNALDERCRALNGALPAPLAAVFDIGRAPVGGSVHFLEGDTLYFYVTCTFPFIHSRNFQVNLRLVPPITQAAVPASLGALRDVHVYVADFVGAGTLTVSGVDYAVEEGALTGLNTNPALQFGQRGNKIVVYSVDPFTVTASPFPPGLAATGKGFVSYAVTSVLAAAAPTTPLWTAGGTLVGLDNTAQIDGKLVIHQTAPFTLVDERNRSSAEAYASLGFERLRPYPAAPYIDLYQCANRQFDPLTPNKLAMQVGQLPAVSPLRITLALCGDPYTFHYVGAPEGAAAALVADPYIGITDQGLVGVIEPTTMTSPDMQIEAGVFVKAVYSVVSSFPVNSFPAAAAMFLGTQITLDGTAEEMAAAVNQIQGFYCSVQSAPPYSFLQIESLNAFSTGIWAAAGFPESRAGILTQPAIMTG